VTRNAANPACQTSPLRLAARSPQVTAAMGLGPFRKSFRRPNVGPPDAGVNAFRSRKDEKEVRVTPNLLRSCGSGPRYRLVMAFVVACETRQLPQPEEAFRSSLRSQQRKISGSERGDLHPDSGKIDAKSLHMSLSKIECR